MSPGAAAAEVFLAALKALPARQRAAVLESIVKDRTFRAVLEGVSDRLVIGEERAKPGRLLQEYVLDREKREQTRTRSRR